MLARGARAKAQAKELAAAAEETRTQVLKALRQARSAWAQMHKHGRPPTGPHDPGH